LSNRFEVRPHVTIILAYQYFPKKQTTIIYYYPFALLNFYNEREEIISTYKPLPHASKVELPGFKPPFWQSTET